MPPSVAASVPRRWSLLLLAMLLAIMVGRIAATYSVFNATIDEGIHIAAGVEIYEAGRYEIDFEQPPLSRIAIALPPYLGGVRVQPARGMVDTGRLVLESSADYWRTLTLGRLGNLIFIPVLIFYVYRWSADLYGSLAGLVAVAIVTWSPTVLGHAGLATIDLSITATLTGAAYHLQRWFRRPSAMQGLAAGCLCGLAMVSKYSAIGFLPPMIAGFFLLANWRAVSSREFWRSAKLRQAALQGLLFFVSLYAVVWVCFQISAEPMSDLGDRRYGMVDRYLPPGSAANRLAGALLTWGRGATPGFLEGIQYATNHAASGHRLQFFLGDLRQGQGWRLYFPVALAVKTTLPFLLLLMLATLGWALGRRDRKDDGTVYVVTAAAVVLLVGVASELNIGIRHVLPIYPLLAIFASALLARGHSSFRLGPLRWKRPVFVSGWVLLALHSVASAVAHPDYVAYFNELARGGEHRILGDSNLDWGQDLARLGRYLEQHKIREVHLSYFGASSPEAVGIKHAKLFGPSDRPRGWVAISIAHLQGLRIDKSEGDYGWLLEHEPHAKIGRSIWLYRLNDVEPTASDSAGSARR